MTPHDLFSEAKARQGRRRDRSGDVADEHLANMEANGTTATTSAVSGLWPEGRKSGIEPRSFFVFDIESKYLQQSGHAGLEMGSIL